MKYLFFLCSTALLVILDLKSKLFFQNLLSQQDIFLWKDFGFKLAFNTGIAFSLPLHGLLQIIITIALIVAISWYFFRHYSYFPFFPSLGFTLILAGAMGNLYERMVYHKVTDFIQVFSWFPIFNLADVFVCVGVGIFCLLEWKHNS